MITLDEIRKQIIKTFLASRISTKVLALQFKTSITEFLNLKSRDSLRGTMRQYAAVVEDPPSDAYGFIYKPNEIVYFLGEIPNMPGHGIFLSLNPEKLRILHIERFREATEEEL